MTAGALWLWLRGMVSHRVAAVLLGAVAVADLWVIDKKFLEDVPGPSVYFAPDEISTFLSRQEGSFRTFVDPTPGGLPQDNYLTLSGVELIGGEHGNQLQTYNEFLGAGERTYTDFHNILGNPETFMALANARYFVTTQQVQVPFLEPVFQGRTRRGQQAIIYENTSVLPRAFIVPTARRAAEPDGALARMNEEDFDPTREVVLYEDPPVVRAADVGLTGATARITHREATATIVEVTSPDSAYLVLTDNYYPDWKVEVNGSPAELLRAYHTFRAVPVPAGTSTVAFTFEPAALTAGFRISLSLWILLLAYATGLGVLEFRRRRTTSPDGAA